MKGLENIDKQLGEGERAWPSAPAGPEESSEKPDNIRGERELSPSREERARRQRNWITECIKDGEWSMEEADNYLRSKWGPESRLTREEREGIIKWQKQFDQQSAGPGDGATGWAGWLKTKMSRSHSTLENAGGPAVSPPPLPRDPSYNMGRRWKGIIEQATIEGVFLADTLVSMPVSLQAGEQH